MKETRDSNGSSLARNCLPDESVLFFAYTRPKRVLDQKLSLLRLTNQRIRHNAWALTEVLAISFR